jgi:hypothetical protein
VITGVRADDTSEALKKSTSLKGLDGKKMGHRIGALMTTARFLNDRWKGSEGGQRSERYTLNDK